MFKFFKSLFQKSDKDKYEREKKIAAGDNVPKKQKLAANPDAHPEILFYLATDKDLETRRAVARNISTPVQAGDILVKDQDVDVRMLLAQRLVKLLPELAEDVHGQLYAFAVKTLHQLARDEVAKIRVALSTALQDHAYAPPEVVKVLAQDVERAVAEPILRHCAKLSDEELLDILQHHPAGWVGQAMAMRDNISPELAEGYAELMDEEGGRLLLENSKHRFSEQTFSKIVEKSREYVSWQEPIALRPELSYALARQLAGFAGDAVLKTLSARRDFDKEMAAEISAMVKRRVAFMSSVNPNETLEQKVNRYVAAGQLTPETISDALAWREEGFVKLGLSRVSGVHQLIIDKIFASQSPKSITALAWYCGLPMRTAVELQKLLGKVPTQSLIYARAGVDYPLNEADMIWQLEFFGIDVDPERAVPADDKSSKNKN